MERYITTLLLLGLTLVTANQLKAADPGKPNVVIFYADDLGWGDLSINNPDPKYFRYTPNIDSISSEGVRLGNYTTHCVCSPSRASLLTAKHFARVAAGPRTGGELPYENLITMGQEFQDNGYVTGAFGKWHNSEPNLPANGTGKLVANDDDIIPDNAIYEYTASKHFGIGVNKYGFDNWAGYYGGGTDMFNRFAPQQDQNNWWVDSVYMGAVEGYTTDLLTDAAVEFIVDNKDENFFCYVPEQAVHHPIHLKKSELMEFCEVLDTERGISGQWEYVKAIKSPTTGKTIEEAGEELKCWKGDEFDLTKIDPGKTHFNHLLFGAYLYSLDKSVGRILDTLESLGLMENTIILFTSDNGGLPEGSSLPFQGGKHSIWEGGVHVPAAIWWPGTFDANTSPYSPTNNIYTGSVSYYDIYPTLMAMTGNSFSVDDPDGINCWPDIQANTEVRPGMENPLFEMWNNHGFVRTNEWKLMYSESANRRELYHYRTDTAEATNVAGANAELTDELVALYKNWLSQNDYAVPFVKIKEENIDFPDPNPDGEILEVEAWQSSSSNNSGVFIRFSNGDFKGGKIGHFIEPGDRVEYDIYFAEDSENTKGIYYSPGAGWNPVFNGNNGINQDSNKVHHLSLPKGKWVRNVVGTGTICPGTSTVNYIVLRGGSKGYYHFYLDNVVIRKNDGSIRSVIWQSGSDTSPIIYRYKNVNHRSLSEAQAVSGFPFSEIKMRTLSTVSDRLLIPFKKYIYRDVTQGEDRMQDFKISNYTAQNVNISSISLGGKDSSFFEIIDDKVSGTSISPMNTKTISLNYNPGTTGGNHSACLIIANDLKQDTIELVTAETIAPVYRVIIDECDVSTDWSSRNSFSLNNTGHREGGACLQSSGMETNEFQKSFSTPINNIAIKKNAILQMWYYVSDIGKFATNNQVEIGSGGKNDVDEFNWNLTGKLANGWNFLNLKFSEAGTNGNPNINAINWVRIYHGKTGSMITRIDGLQIIDPSITAPSKASFPQPVDKASDESQVIRLSWTPGSGSQSSDVYFDTVNPPAFLASVTGSSYSFSSHLDPGKTYYWRIDGKNVMGGTEGDVWSFTTAEASTTSKSTPSPVYFNLIPNPSTGHVKLLLPESSGRTNFQVLDMNGSRVAQKSLTENEIMLDLSHLGKGIYLVRVGDQKHISSRKLIIE